MGLQSLLNNLFSKGMAIDLGTANTLIHVRGMGLVVDEPSMVAIARENGKVVAVGRTAKEMYGKTSESVRTIRPMRDGVIADFEVTRVMINTFIRQALKRKPLFRPQMVICIPSGITAVEKKAVIDSAEQAGAGKVYLMEEPMAAAIGANLPIQEPKGSMVVDIGGGTTEVAIIASSAIASSESIRVAGDEMDEAILQYIRQRYNLQIGPFEAERIKIRVGAAYPQKERLECMVRGRDLIEGVPRTLTITDEMVRESLESPIMAIVESVRRTLDKSSPELAADVYDHGIVLAGGGALLRGLDDRIHQEIGLQVHPSEDPLRAVVRGSGFVLENFKNMGKVCVN
ncbi:MAG: rod shape-determining protein [Candidatus Tectomicrobia bacterium]|uniref:Cell shape-determining protein MreB n=1 Tax=Tectimicrobiota bacterium TaxID=2528274 RepID=A0A932CMT8_UNCTE|nr:rod shape-determining protein [Candidatus Tectomicrobia bacterium]